MTEELKVERGLVVKGHDGREYTGADEFEEALAALKEKVETLLNPATKLVAIPVDDDMYPKILLCVATEDGGPKELLAQIADEDYLQDVFPGCPQDHLRYDPRAREESPQAVQCTDKSPQCPGCDTEGLMIRGKVEFYGDKPERNFESDVDWIEPDAGPQFGVTVEGNISGTYDEVLYCSCGWEADLGDCTFKFDEGPEEENEGVII